MNDLYGTLHTPIKTSSYIGINSDTIDLTVNNTDRTIIANLDSNLKSIIERMPSDQAKLEYTLHKEIDDRAAELLENLNRFYPRNCINN